MSRLFVFGLGYTARHLSARLTRDGWSVAGTGSAGTVDFEDERSVLPELAAATHILSSVPPGKESDPVLARYEEAIRSAPARWIGYLSSTGVYGDTAGAWVDETAPIGTGRRSARAQADLAWQALREDVRIFRLPGIYGPGRSAIERVREGRAHRIDLPDQIFSRVHVDDIANGVIASFTGAAGIYNLADNRPAPQNSVIEHACALLGISPPPLLSLDEAALSPMGRAFYSENRRVANGKAKRLLEWQPLYPSYVEGLAACLNSSRVPARQ